VVTDTGVSTITAPEVFRSPPGVKRAVRSITDTVWLTIHANPDNQERTEDEMADRLTVKDYDELAAHERSLLPPVE